MAVTPASLEIVYPEFIGIDDARVQIFIDRAARNMNEEQWGEKYDDGLTDLAAHMLAQALEEGDAAPSAPASDSAGGVSTSYQAVSGEKSQDSELSATSYGRSYLRQLRTIFVTRVI